MKNLKRFLCTLLCIAMCAGMVIPTAATATVPTGIESVDDLLASFDEGSYTQLDMSTQTQWTMNPVNDKLPASESTVYLGEDCLKICYNADIPWFWLDKTKSLNYILSPKAASKDVIPANHKYVVITYSADSTVTSSLDLRIVGKFDTDNDPNTPTEEISPITIIPNVSASGGEWACSEVIEISPFFFTRFNCPDYVAFYFDEDDQNANIYIDSLNFFADAEDAATYAELAPILMDPDYVPEEPEEEEPDDPRDAVVTFEVVTEEDYYNVGDTITADIVATSTQDINVYSVNFELVVPAGLTLKSLDAAAATEDADIDDERFAWAYNGEDNQLEITTDGVVVATAEFEIDEDLDEEVEIKVDPDDVGLNNGKDEAKADAESVIVPVYDIEITVIGENTTLASGVDLFARYDEADLYEDEARTVAYDLATELEANEGYAITGYEFDNGEGPEEIDLDTFTFTESGTLTAITTAEITVTFVDGVNGSVTGEDKELVLLPGQTLEEILEENGIGYAADENYEFVSWVDGDGNEIDVTDKINSSITIKPVFTGVEVDVTPAYLNLFKKSEAIEDADTIQVTVAKFANNLQVTVADIDGYFLEKVTYTQDETETEMAKQSGDVYASLAALNSASEITVTAYYSKLVTVEFFAKDDIATLTGQTEFYAKQYEGKLYTDEACETEATAENIPTFEYKTNEDEGYKSVAMADEEAWLIGENDYANEDLLTFAYEADTTIEPNSDTEYKVTFTYTPGGVITGLNGATDDVEFWAKKGTAMDTIAVPEINTLNDDQYETEFTDLADEVSGAVTYIAAATPKSYDVNFTNTDGMLEIDVTEGTYSVDLEFTVSINAASEKKGYIAPETVTYKVGEGEEVEIIAEDGVFTISGDKITDVITVTAVAVKDTFELTVPADVIINETAAEGTVKFQVGDTVTVEVADGTLVSGITYTVAGLEGEFEAAYENGVYALDPEKLVGNVEITVNTLDVTFEYITADNYMALAAGTKILLVKGAGAEKVVALADETDVFWSEKYSAHVAIVDAEASANDLANGMTVTDGDPDAIAYDGDVNASGATLAADAAYVNYMLHNNAADVEDIERLEADFNGDGKVSTEDCQAILNVYLNAQQGN